jgi:hypothetical protein
MFYRMIFISLLTLFNIMYGEAEIDCKIHIDISKDHNDNMIFKLSYDDRCEVVVDQNSTQVIIKPKNIDINRTSDSNTIVEDLNMTESIITLAESKIGASYGVAKAGPDHFDCSGFVYYVFRSNGIDIPRTSLNQSKSGKKLNRDEIERGNILFFDTYERDHINHSGIYLGDGKFIHSSSGRAYGVTISDLDRGFYKDKFRWGVDKIKKDQIQKDN